METIIRNFPDLKNCNVCPQDCKADRTNGPYGKCKTDSGFNIAAISLHKGEEPSISGKFGICNIFFTGCNLRCLYCQNHQISGSQYKSREEFNTLDQILDEVQRIKELGAEAIGFVSPSHVLPQVIKIIEGMEEREIQLTKVYNTNAYELPESLKLLEGKIDVYLPDYKYSSRELAYEYSGTRDYPEYALKSIKEMYRQKGSVLLLSEKEEAESGIIIRHLVLPGEVENSLNVLRNIAEEISTNLHISLMSQYFPTEKVKSHPALGRAIYESEYQQICDEMYNLGFIHGWTQEFDKRFSFRPDFDKIEPFDDSLNHCT